MKQFLKFLLILLPSIAGADGGFLYAQKQGQACIDSLLKELPKQKEDTNKVKFLDDLSMAYCNINSDAGIKWEQQGLDLATKLDWKNGVSNANFTLGWLYQSKSDYAKALEFYFKALKIDEESRNKNGISAEACIIGVVYQHMGDYPKALDYYFKALKVNEELGNNNTIASVTGNIGNVYDSQNDFAKALEYYYKCLKMSEKGGNKINIINATSNIGFVYSQLKDYKKAMEFEFRALKMAEEIGNKFILWDIFNNIGLVYTAQHNYTDGIDYYFKALKLVEETGNRNALSESLKDIAEAYLHIVTDKNILTVTQNPSELGYRHYSPDSLIPKGRIALLHKSIAYLQKAIVLEKEIGALDNLQSSYKSLSEADSLLGDYREALKAYKSHTLYNDSVFNEARKTEIMRLGMVRKMDADSLTSAQQRQVIEIKYKQQRGYTYLGIAGVVILIGFSFFIVRERGKSEKERKKSDGLLLNILPAEVANELKEKGVSIAKQFDNVTILFTDFVAFTAAGEAMKPQALVDELHTCFKAFDEITTKYSIEKIKTIGDAYFAVCGLPKADSKHAENIVNAAKEIYQFMEDRLAKLGRDRTFEIRIGIHSGSVVAGIVGIKKFAYDIWGDAVNTAARMEQNSEPGKINISQTTYDLVKDKISCTYRGEIDAKGKGMLKMYYVSP